MTQTKRHLPNQAYFSSRRTHDGEFLLLDDREHKCRQVILYSLGLHAISPMSMHRLLTPIRPMRRSIFSYYRWTILNEFSQKVIDQQQRKLSAIHQRQASRYDALD